MTKELGDLLLWVLPPVLGAVIGFVTNAVAIRMLFRPYREWRFLGVRVPFTPGIIPRQRYKLAESIGQMVSKELLTADTFLSQIRSDAFLKGLRTAVSGASGNLLNASIGEIGLKKGSTTGLNLAPMVEGLIRGFLRSKGIQRIIYLVIHTGLHSLTDRKIGELFREESQREQFIEWVYGLLRSPTTGDRFVAGTSAWFRDKSATEVSVGDYVPPEARDWVVGIADVLYEPFFAFILDWIESDTMRKQLEVRGRYLLRDVLDKLSGFQRFLVAATQYDRTLDERMPEIISDTIASMRETVADSSTRKKMLDTIGGSIDRLRGQTVAEINAAYDIPNRIGNAFGAIQNTIAESPTGDSLKAVLGNILAQLEKRSVESFLEHALTVDDAADYLTELVVESVQNAADGISRAAVSHLEEVVDGSAGTPIGELLGFTEQTKLKLDAKLVEMAVGALEAQVPGILASLDLYGVVVTKINGLSVEDVEGLLMRIIHRHLKWINVFGAILGFLIGMVQVATRLF